MSLLVFFHIAFKKIDNVYCFMCLLNAKRKKNYKKLKTIKGNGSARLGKCLGVE